MNDIRFCFNESGDGIRVFETRYQVSNRDVISSGNVNESITKIMKIWE